jgi:phenylacetate-CoA ligase
LLKDVLGCFLPRYRWQVVVEEGLEILDLEVSMDESFFSDEIKSLEGLCRVVRRHLQDHLGLNARVTLKE